MKPALDQKQLRERNTTLKERGQVLWVELVRLTGETVKKPETQNLDDVAANAVLEDYLAVLTDKMSAALALGGSGADHVQAIVARNQMLQGKVDELTTALADRDAKLKSMEAKYSDFDAELARRTAAEVMKHGVNPTAAVSVSKVTTAHGEKVNLTALCQEQNQSK